VFNFVLIELTNYCNFNCYHCPHAILTRSKGFMTFELYKSVVDQAIPITKEINFGYFGEQLLHPEFYKFMRYLKNKPIKIMINTNFSLITNRHRKLFLDINLTELRVGLGNIRVKANQDVVTLKLKDWFKKEHSPTKLVYTITSNNKDNQHEFVKFWEPYLDKKDSILSKTMLTYGGKMKDTEIITHACNENIRKNLVISWDGKVSPCHLDTEMNLEIGDATTETLKSIYTHSYKKLGVSDICNDCVDGGVSKKMVYKK